MAAWTYHVPDHQLWGWHESVAVGAKIYHFEVGDGEEWNQEEEDEEDEEVEELRQGRFQFVYRREAGARSHCPLRGDYPPPWPWPGAPCCNLRVRIFDTEDFSWRTVPLLPSDTQGDEGQRLPPDVLSLAVVVRDHMVFLLGTTRDRTVRCFDTRTLQWSCIETRGVVPRGAVWNFACLINGTIFAWGRHSLSQKCVFALELSSLTWRCVDADDGPNTCQATLNVAQGTCIYVLYSRRPRLDAKRDDCCLAVFDTTREQWQRLGLPYGRKLLFRCTYSVFTHERRIYAVGCRSITSPELMLLEYCPQRNLWHGTTIRGVTPGDYLRSPVVVGGRVFFLSPNQRAVHALDFRPSLRTLCFMAVAAQGIDCSTLPDSLQKELQFFKGKPWLEPRHIHSYRRAHVCLL